MELSKLVNYFSKNFEITTKDGLIVFVELASIFVLLVVTAPINSLDSVNAQQKNITKTGLFNHTQTDTTGIPERIYTGSWSLTKSPTVVITFDAIINVTKPDGSDSHMTKPDGSDSHKHKVGNLVIPYAPINHSNSTIISGTTTITMNDRFFISEVPTNITLNEKDMSVYFDPAKLNNHFGNQTIKGSVTQ
ncbi:MAG TPA: hypothetical protein VLE21_00115 [Candidatus Nitrosocosmicus sp.]|nr:hypothetical protein [Candidatus Nitrosocosmicus sp.]